MCVDLDFVFLLWRLSEWLPHVGFDVGFEIDTNDEQRTVQQYVGNSLSWV